MPTIITRGAASAQGFGFAGLVPVTRLGFDSAHKGTDIALSNGNKTETLGGAGGSYQNVNSLSSHSTGKYYFEFSYVAVNNPEIGFATAANSVSVAITQSVDAVGLGDMGATSLVQYNSGTLGHVTPLISANGKVAIDFFNGRVWFAAQGSGASNWNNNNGNPATNTNGFDISTLMARGALYIAAAGFATGDTITINTGSMGFNDSVPSGFTPGW